ncbi:hypothetical protein ACH5RR_039147 [Cinchona calisaya]|uniref:Uncharacterized protein n=1 Tax=Cinchona calisaya TaxID=153742 RepID=A0ABD2XXG4_9GENT
MIKDYDIFGDVVSFDTIYRTNKAYRPLASFVGMNNHREMVIFGAALLHVLKVLDAMNFKTMIPSQYVFERWTKSASNIEEIKAKGDANFTYGWPFQQSHGEFSELLRSMQWPLHNFSLDEQKLVKYIFDRADENEVIVQIYLEFARRSVLQTLKPEVWLVSEQQCMETNRKLEENFHFYSTEQRY